jgi:signal transduction histidine kinase
MTRRHGARRRLFLGSSCIYPKLAPQPLREDSLLTGPLEPSNRPYAIAKIAGIELIWDAREMPEELNINPDAVLPILRIVQESLTNALKHSAARAVSVSLQVTQAGDEAPMLQIRVTDNGKGISRVGDLNTPHLRPKKEKGTAQFDGATSMEEWSSNPTGYSGSF